MEKQDVEIKIRNENKNIEIKLEKQEVEIKIRNKNKNIKQELWHWNPSIGYCVDIYDQRITQKVFIHEYTSWQSIYMFTGYCIDITG